MRSSAQPLTLTLSPSPGRGNQHRRVRPALLLALLALASPARAGDLDVARARLLAAETGQGADASDPLVAAAIAGVCSSAAGLAASLTATGAWPDLAYTDLPAGPWSIGTHYSRVHRVAQGWRMPACTGLSGDAAVLAKLEAALRYAQTWYCETCARPGNWWWWNIGVPHDLGPTLLLLEGSLSAPVFGGALAALDANVAAQQELTGANLADHALNTLPLAVLRADAARAAAAKAELESLCVLAPPAATSPYLDLDGIKPDLSFHQHNGQLYTGGYGQVFIEQAARWVLLTDGTGLALAAERQAVVDDFLLFGVAWTLDLDDFDHLVLGRGVTRQGNHASGALGALLRLAPRDGPRRAELLAATKAMLGAWRYGFPLETAPLVAAVRAAPGDGGWPLGHRHFPDSEFTVHRAARFYASVKLLSARTLSGENTNTECRRCARASDGQLYLTLRGDEYQGDVVPTLDWARLPGITVERTANAADTSFGPGLRTFVGGTGDGERGVAAMDFAPALASGSQLTARKSWFFFDDALVALAAGVDCPTSNPVESVVQQWPLSAADAGVVVDGVPQPSAVPWTATLPASWLAAEGLGVWFPGGATVNVAREVRSGRWSDLGLGSDTLVEHPMLTLWIDHGAPVTGATAAWALVPGVDAAQMAAWAAAPPLEVLSNTAALAAVRDRRTGATGVVFWRPGTAAGLTAPQPALAWLQPDGGELALFIADPSQQRSALTLTLEGRFEASASDPGVQVTTSDAGTRLDVPVANGRTVAVTLRPAAEPAPPAKAPCGCASGGEASLLIAAGWLLRRTRASGSSGSREPGAGSHPRRGAHRSTRNTSTA